jgi:hypothetical protein
MDTDDETSSVRFGYATPPLSPTKTISTEGCFSPRTPGSPRKTRSCAFIRGIDYGGEPPCFTPPASPTKSKSTLCLGQLTIPEVLKAPHEFAAPQSDSDSPVKQHVPLEPGRSRVPWPPTPARLHSPSTSNEDTGSSDDDASSPTALTFEPRQPGSYLGKQRRFRRSLSESLVAAANASTIPCAADTFATDLSSQAPLSPAWSQPLVPEPFSPSGLRRLPLRHASSPLRSSQWATRGGLLPSPSRKGQSSTPDRFIAARRPPAVTRESYELSKPCQRLETDQAIGRGGRRNRDPFSRRLGRSGRLNEELRGLRDAHSMILGRAGAQRRNANLAHRRSSLALGIREVSAGAVWNVGGPSAVSNTVVGVSTGRGGMLGSGTNAPLYTSSFLDRADPEAELEAYEHRLALALDVDQADRVLQHSPSPSTSHGVKQLGCNSRTGHIWRDSAWSRDETSPRLSSFDIDI